MKQPEIIWQDDYILAINKPEGWVVNDSNTISNAESLQNWIDNNFASPDTSFETAHNKFLRNGLVHRLDKPTSGIILIAKTPKIFEELQHEFADRTVEKTYTALVHGEMKKEKGEIKAKIGRLPWKRTKFGVFSGGREAVTDYRVLRIIPSEHLSLLELYPKTGRTHQLRVHMKHINHPIVGDFLYAGRKLFRQDQKTFGRLMLHAKKIKFVHPVTKKVIELEAPIPVEFK